MDIIKYILIKFGESFQYLFNHVTDTNLADSSTIPKYKMGQNVAGNIDNNPTIEKYADIADRDSAEKIVRIKNIIFYSYNYQNATVSYLALVP
jgi:hypothetical protein